MSQPWSYPLALPSKPFAKKSKITALAASSVSRSPFTFEEQAFLYQGAAWAIEMQWPPMTRAQAEYFIAVFIKLQGRYGTFLAYDYDGANPRGAGVPGAGVIDGAGQTGYVLNTRGWAASTSGILLTGDYIQIGTGAQARLYKVTDDANSDGSGKASFNIWPPLRAATFDGNTVHIQKCLTQFRLDAAFEWDADEVSTYGVSITATEAL